MAFVDLDSDGDLDLAATNHWSDYLVVFLNAGAGAYGTPREYAVGSSPQALATGDIDGDGYRDIVTANTSSGSVSVVMNATGMCYHTLSVARAGSGSGTVTSSPAGIGCGSDCGQSYIECAEVTLLATPTPGSAFTGWSGSCTGTGPCMLTMSANRTVTATFTLPTVSMGGDVSMLEGNSGTTNAVFSVTLSRSSSVPVTVQYATVEGTADAPSDYTAVSGILTFAPGSTGQSLSVPVVGDTRDEPNERFYVNLSGASNATIDDGQAVGTIQDDDGGTLQVSELTHGFEGQATLAARPGPSADADLYALLLQPYSSYEIVVDGTSGDIGDGSGPILETVAADALSILASSVPVGRGPSRSLRLENVSSYVEEAGYVRVRSASCTTDCGADDVYRIRAYETTLAAARFNNSATQVTVLVLQNPSDGAISGNVYFWGVTGTLLATQPLALSAKQTLVLSTKSVSGVAGVSGTITVSHDGRYGDLLGKTVALEPATGFSFDGPLVWKER